ncbi:ras-related protein rab-5c [Anaeramoeba flamelloides]|uniref:Ras-related protein rab-5c n=1 Tax=Anaeramoeba flamelloides TaxID=1746091 RepID=A0AAV7YIV4_9EUKA|nr:ras-related protein rab-5c [Anaeramoeba flamelloides]
MSSTNSSMSSDEEEKKEIVIKIVMLGQCGTGKSSLVIRFIKNEFLEDIKTTVGANFFLSSVNFDEKTYSIRLWDTSGQEKFNSLTPLYYRNSNIAILVYDIKNISSLEKVKFWIKEIKNHVRVMPLIVIVSNKMDEYNKELDFDTLVKAQEIANKIGAEFVQTSAKTGEGVNDLFTKITQKLVLERSSQICQTIDQTIFDTSPSQQIEIGSTNETDQNEKSTSKCCF